MAAASTRDICIFTGDPNLTNQDWVALIFDHGWYARVTNLSQAARSLNTCLSVFLHDIARVVEFRERARQLVQIVAERVQHQIVQAAENYFRELQDELGKLPFFRMVEHDRGRLAGRLELFRRYVSITRDRPGKEHRSCEKNVLIIYQYLYLWVSCEISILKKGNISKTREDKCRRSLC